MLPYGDKEIESSDSENEDISQSQMSRSVSSIQSTQLDDESAADRLSASVEGYFQNFKMNCFPEAGGMTTKVQPWRHIWDGPQPPSKDGKLLVACPKNCQFGSGSGLGGY